MLNRLARFFVHLMQKYLPAPFLFAIILTLIVFVLGIVATDSGPGDMVIYWGDGFWNLLEFAMQMALVLVTGHVMANSRPIKRILNYGASIPNNPTQAIVMVSFISAVACWINWGFGLVVGALFAKEMAKVVRGLDYRLVIASAYSGFLVWHAGFSASVPLAVATEGHDFEELVGVISTSETIFSIENLIISAAVIVMLPLLNKAMMPKKEEVVEIDASLLEDEVSATDEENELETVADRIENSKAISLIIGIMGLAYIGYYFLIEEGTLGLNIVNFIFLFVGILLHGTPKQYLKALPEAAKAASGIIIQFPFYAGIMGMMTASGLAAVISQGLVNMSTETTFPIFSFLSAGIVNFFVPSGGGQWAVQAPIMLPASLEMGVDVAKTCMAVAWGDAWTNMIQPFWALPALGIAGLGARDIMGYCLMALLFSGVIIIFGLLIF
ncbi:short-chain fatty acid transporter [Natranaerobius thermophilus]|uniref:Short chain fatty acid transporter n=1 Tax=Natranaerobius thermophilus (strain ATCC BAA-1301 / DSM 18059 / JW/NM-WN-LF) TaxID=457570 RepID=B2A847_NATTJ|nr:short-chain fatty acid transporter [Natranaerobius thermophilus]ACB85815.1 short chain fatty acid transporter [Natranaerobius thermophilus JW/NM-WN-LF]